MEHKHKFKIKDSGTWLKYYMYFVCSDCDAQLVMDRVRLRLILRGALPYNVQSAIYRMW